jgi:hypothetical protein
MQVHAPEAESAYAGRLRQRKQDAAKTLSLVCFIKMPKDSPRLQGKENFVVIVTAGKPL